MSDAHPSLDADRIAAYLERPPPTVLPDDLAGVVRALRQQAALRCGYLSRRGCDCKFGASLRGEETGCPELAVAALLLERLSPEDYRRLAEPRAPAGLFLGMTRGEVAEDMDAVAHVVVASHLPGYLQGLETRQVNLHAGYSGIAFHPGHVRRPRAETHDLVSVVDGEKSWGGTIVNGEPGFKYAVVVWRRRRP